jgi:hypothetical protein
MLNGYFSAFRGGSIFPCFPMAQAFHPKAVRVNILQSQKSSLIMARRVFFGTNREI